MYTRPWVQDPALKKKNNKARTQGKKAAHEMEGNTCKLSVI
jgi:hypothetical protein